MTGTPDTRPHSPADAPPLTASAAPGRPAPSAEEGPSSALSPNVATLSEFLRLLAARETMRQALSMVADDFVALEPASLPYGGAYHGPTGLLDMLRAVNSVVRLDIEDIRLSDAGDLVMARVEVTLVVRDTGERLRTRIVELYTVAEGSIRKLDVFYHDTAAVHRLLGT
ncbi:nuclear transport factor 2 family protein [Streptomyces chlorus]|uniref:Nuclear transport factor 2 family protein n=1 Tax=Streptomyces chlorus TaxID=887452 RepID=A0ABW1DYH6_9ACTN